MWIRPLKAINNLPPVKSGKLYVHEYAKFLNWCSNKKIHKIMPKKIFPGIFSKNYIVFFYLVVIILYVKNNAQY